MAREIRVVLGMELDENAVEVRGREVVVCRSHTFCLPQHDPEKIPGTAPAPAGRTASLYSPARLLARPVRYPPPYG